jgi:4-amino-4-deoxy-L-arabinose transferase-like glycosyltransferase
MINISRLKAMRLNSASERSMLYWLALIAIIGFGSWLRLHGLDAVSLTQDETSMLQFTFGLLERGYPVSMRGDSENLMATYELVPYFIAASVKLFGWSEWAVRLPAASFSIATLILVAATGRWWFGRTTSLWAALLYAISPWALYWSQNCFYPAQLQFFALLSVILVHYILSTDRPRAASYWLTALCLGLTYFSWEGIGLMFVVLGIMAIALRWRRWNFLLSTHAWAALGTLGLLVVLQLVRRAVLREPYLVLGSSRADISSPQLAMKQLTYDPLYYFETVFLSEQMLILTCFFFLGIWFLRKDWNLRFVYMYVVLMVVVYSELLAVQTIRYIYAVLPFFLLAVAAASTQIFTWTFRQAQPAAPVMARALGYSIAILMLGMQAATLSHQALNLSELNPRYQTQGRRELGEDVARVDFRAAMMELKRRYRAGDVVIVRAPFPLYTYTGIKGDFALQQTTRSVVFYEPGLERSRYMDKYVGNPLLRSLTELKDLLYKHDRVWLVAAPFGPLRNLMGDDTYEFVSRNMALEYEGQSVRLYLWNNPNG